MGVERKSIETTLRLLKERKVRHGELAVMKQQQEEIVRRELEKNNQTQQTKQQAYTPPIVAQLEEWWQVRPNSSGLDLNLLLRMFNPSCGLLSKRNEVKWSHIETTLLPRPMRLM